MRPNVIAARTNRVEVAAPTNLSHPFPSPALLSFSLISFPLLPIASLTIKRESPV